MKELYQSDVHRIIVNAILKKKKTIKIKILHNLSVNIHVIYLFLNKYKCFKKREINTKIASKIAHKKKKNIYVSRKLI